MRRTLTRLAGAGLAALVLGALPLRAQDAGAQPEGTPLPEDLAPLREHYRPSLHPGDPLHIVGLEQDGNELRAKTPVLARGEHDPLQVDIDASYRRALALYGGKLYHVPLAAAAASEPKPSAKHPRYVEPEPEPEPEARGPAATPWSVLAGLSVSVLLLVWYFVRVRPALVAPFELLEGAQQAPAAGEGSEEFVFRPTRRAPAPFRPILQAPASPLPHRPSVTGSDARPSNSEQRR